MWNRKATDSQLIEAYEEDKSVWRVAKRFGMCGQSVHERLKKLIDIKNNCLSEDEKRKIKNLYESGFEKGDGKLNILCKELSRRKPSIARAAKRMNLTRKTRVVSKNSREKSSIIFKEWHKKNAHPRGMLGKHHSKEYCDKISERVKKWNKTTSRKEKNNVKHKMLQTKLKRYGTLANPRTKVSWKQGWRVIGDKKIYFRSRWEANYGRYLEFLKVHGNIKNWEHEPQTFWFKKVKRGVMTYLPDFKVIENDGTHFWAEVKGYYDARSKTKIRRFRKQYPEEKLILIDAKWFKKNNRKMKGLIPGWEIDRINIKLQEL